MISRPVMGDLAVPVNLCQIRYLTNPSHKRYIRLATGEALRRVLSMYNFKNM
jgi:hypothetical protein